MARRAWESGGRTPLRTLGLLWLCLWVGCGRSRVEELIEALQAGDLQSRRDAARMLGELGPEAAPAAGPLAAALLDADPELQRLSAQALPRLGLPASEVAPAVRPLLEHEKLSVRLTAAFTLLDLDPADESPRPALLQAMTMGEGGTIVAVAARGPDVQWAIPTLIDLLRDRRAGIRRLAAEALGQIGATTESTAALRRALSDTDDRVRESAQMALKSPGPS
jgi:HEAT repeat protein